MAACLALGGCLLAACYQRALTVARDARSRTIAFPAISTGVYGFPAARAARIAVSAIVRHGDGFDRIVLCCFSSASAEHHRAALADIGEAPEPPS